MILRGESLFRGNAVTDSNVKRINEHFTEAEHAALSEVKADRTWRTAILEEFGVTTEVEA